MGFWNLNLWLVKSNYDEWLLNFFINYSMFSNGGKYATINSYYNVSELTVLKLKAAQMGACLTYENTLVKRNSIFSLGGFKLFVTSVVM